MFTFRLPGHCIAMATKRPEASPPKETDLQSIIRYGQKQNNKLDSPISMATGHNHTKLSLSPSALSTAMFLASLMPWLKNPGLSLLSVQCWAWKDPNVTHFIVTHFIVTHFIGEIFFVAV